MPRRQGSIAIVVIDIDKVVGAAHMNGSGLEDRKGRGQKILLSSAQLSSARLDVVGFDVSYLHR